MKASEEIFWSETVFDLAEEAAMLMNEKSPSQYHSIAALELTLAVLKNVPHCASVSAYLKQREAA